VIQGNIVLTNRAQYDRAKTFPTQATLRLFLTFALLGAAASAQIYHTLYSFGGRSGAPNDPRYSGIIAQGRDGNMYSTAPDTWSGKPGAAYKITPAGVLTVLHQFNGTDGQAPVSGLTLAHGGNYYGTTLSGGTSGNGTIFRMGHLGNVTTLYNLTAGDGSSSFAPPIEGLDGHFYGVIYGTPTSGSVYKISWTGEFTILHSFTGLDGASPTGPLVLGTDGNFYGTTTFGGASGAGVIFRISASGDYKVLYSFTGPQGSPLAGLIEGSDGNFYGATGLGEIPGDVVFKITPQGEFTVLHTFTCGADGCNQAGGLVQATDGNIYGTNTRGVLFRIDSAGNFTPLYVLCCSPQMTLLQHTNGVLYGTSCCGGNFQFGSFFSFDLGLPPFVHFLRMAGEAGRTIEFLGQGFTGTSAVAFNGTTAVFTVVSDTFLTATVPAGATTGFVTVTTPTGTLTSDKKFLVR
jgi:uncharacterized repeat protein (TIGR03803 family)